ncbi:ParB N-terminal domain-containing protein [Leptospira santarosai]|uniref:ParB N-terminal domain-containing protein n=1 Tax=Leptospira santarosai TaxID=28183 RepID=UPI0024AFD974|nr:ParB N-terminal domain-containing protein [Leptospira santarosai]MDI7175135.1 chromosome partitioning protein ParB [Leptospira santarosai]MDI7193756.1 chromosome partitioning protein ParB [Leptospira santarosai]MDO6399188.1 chromosome partitioning protein ParB [Leptospira santarosai]MDO6403595.1 chromosome partitioning protein ParB [Leptospira santarosai]
MNPKKRKRKTNSSKVPKQKSRKPKKAIKKIPSPKSISPGDYLDRTVKFVSPKKLKPNPRNDFDPLTTEEYNNLKQNIITNGILDPLTAKKGGMIVTGENRYKIALELKTHEDKAVRKRIAKIPVRYYTKRLTHEEEYERMESDNLFRRHLTPEQRKVRLKQRILRLYQTELIQENRGGDRKSKQIKQERSNLHLEGLKTEKTKQTTVLLQNKRNEDQKKVLTPAPQTFQITETEQKDVAKKISENEKIPLGTATRYVAEIRKELLPQESKPEKKPEETKEKPLKEIVREFRKRYTRMTKSQREREINRLKGTLIKLNYEWDKLHQQIDSNENHKHQIFEKLRSVGEGDVIQKVNKFLDEKEKSRSRK